MIEQDYLTLTFLEKDIWNLDIVQSTVLPHFKIKGEEFKIRRCFFPQLSVERFWMTRYSE